MAQLQIVVYCGGEWKSVGNEWTYLGDKVVCKPITVGDPVSIPEIRMLIAKRFQVDETLNKLELTYKNTLNKALQPFDIETVEDFEDFVEVNQMTQPCWSVPLCVRLKSTIIIPEIEEINEYHPHTAIVPAPSVTEIETENSYAITEVEPEETQWGLKLGQKFKDKNAVKSALCLNAVAECTQYRITKSIKLAILARCLDKDCKWRVRFSKIKKSKVFTLTKYTREHTCSFHTRRNYRRKVSYPVIAEIVAKM